MTGYSVALIYHARRWFPAASIGLTVDDAERPMRVDRARARVRELYR
jgi:hypothetical protein